MMANANQKRATRGDRPSWVRPFCRVHRALDASVRLIDSTMRTVARSERCAHRRPVRTSARLLEASGLLREATARLKRAAEQLAVTNECLRLEPANMDIVPELLFHAAGRWVEVTAALQQAAAGVFSLHDDVLLGVQTGVYVPERPAERRPRIILAPRPAPVRAFLLLRQPRVVERIAPLLRRRRRTPRPASIRVPRRSLLGRAPPGFEISLL
ncbi:MAG TPA: hypothetical protein VGF28_10200 [Thermoanaerobaculia bacterium]|jgi:hypothetical protein